MIYAKECVLCHGEDGNLGNAGSANLLGSFFSVQDIIETIKTGRGDMPPFDYLSEKEVSAVAEYTKQLQIK